MTLSKWSPSRRVRAEGLGWSQLEKITNARMTSLSTIGFDDDPFCLAIVGKQLARSQNCVRMLFLPACLSSPACLLHAEMRCMRFH